LSTGVAPQTDAESVLGFSFNLWSEPWITVELLDGGMERVSIRNCLLEAHRIANLVDPSPLVVAGLQRLLAAIVQEIIQPRHVPELGDLISRAAFDAAGVEAFGSAWGSRFDLFSDTHPFLQSADIGLKPAKTDRQKTVGYLFPEEPTATNINHFQHRYDDDYQFSPATAALGLVTIPAFSTSGGSGIKPSINGVPPLYVLPQGRNLYETLVLSLVVPEFQPVVRDKSSDRPAWNRDPVIARGQEVLEVGYLESLTFPARRVRLFPEHASGYDSRTGEWSNVLIRKMVFDMGISRSKDLPPWFDPFAAYRNRTDGPVPIRPQEGKTLWREYGNLFQTSVSGNSTAEGTNIAPAVVHQIAILEDFGFEGINRWRFRCIGMRTDMKTKVFEWVDDTLDVPQGLLNNPLAQHAVELAIADVEAWAKTLLSIHRTVYGDGRENFATQRERLRTSFWVHLNAPFRTLIDDLANAPDQEALAGALNGWRETFFRVGYEQLSAATENAGERSTALVKRAEALTRYSKARGKKRKDWGMS
jgi:CRISPR system Cascade subunit CasA